ncbi:type III secretion inner membrane ring lipoprotein SctJ [Providencia rettgeri]|nr:type III secretion inner membrane ring lipoprotein SctJ [Providencia rettgeri]EJD6374459.1 type III secretion inner membrane ring lipoprotein SctJ [Providencia rettgeri]EJD6401723.1 type III secretion inner membrane ring lipoprotein SctJ [Providencia rettgeri]EJD6411807.1 type III secretion inner membrane ring lipoprotein SctJ [Providencia rettgeri]EJD6500435.1 type III secretion inner membrane ring lipoprotein SctJ [Providencia rettgeri]
MMKFFIRFSSIVLILFFLTGCKVELYSDLSEEEANQMIALLMLRNIDAEKSIIKGSGVTINVEKDDFANAVEVLRQQGLPNKRTENIADLFPPGQLVTSPAQEQAKITYLKEQNIEKMLLSMDGVIIAQVAISESTNVNRREIPPPTASIFIKHAPGINMQSREPEIRRMVQKSISNLTVENISIVMQMADYRHKQAKFLDKTKNGWEWRKYLPWIVVAAIMTSAIVLLIVLRNRPNI